MTQKQIQNIKDRIEKLLALGQSPNENEAELAMANAQKLLAKYNLTMTDIQGKEKSEVGQNIFETGSRQNKWRTNLLSGIAQGNYCEMIISKRKGSYNLIVIGKAHNVEIVKAMFDYLVDAVNSWAKKNGGKGSASKNSYRLGMANGLSMRLVRMKNEMERNGLEVDGETTTALVVVENAKALQKANDDFMRTTFRNLKTSRERQRISNHNSYNNGYNDSSNIGLNAQVTA